MSPQAGRAAAIHSQKPHHVSQGPSVNHDPAYALARPLSQETLEKEAHLEDTLSRLKGHRVTRRCTREGSEVIWACLITEVIRFAGSSCYPTHWTNGRYMFSVPPMIDGPKSISLNTSFLKDWAFAYPTAQRVNTLHNSFLL